MCHRRPGKHRGQGVRAEQLEQKEQEQKEHKELQGESVSTQDPQAGGKSANMDVDKRGVVAKRASETPAGQSARMPKAVEWQGAVTFREVKKDGTCCWSSLAAAFRAAGLSKAALAKPRATIAANMRGH